MVMRTISFLLLVGPSAVSAAGTTCGDVKTAYRDQGCCGQDAKAFDASGIGGVSSSCPYNFNKPECKDAEPQAPRDLSTGATGERVPKAATLNDAQQQMLPLANVHFHLGAEHKSDSYNDGSHSEAYDNGRRLATDVRPGWMCSTTGMDASQLAPYEFQHCKGDVQVGKSYEIHWVHSSAGYHPEDIVDADFDAIDDGLGGAANGRGMLNPMVVVNAQVLQIVRDVAEVSDLLHAWSVLSHDNSVMYPGSTTGPSHNNEICSPYAVTWHVDKMCHQVRPEDFDQMCADMKATYNMEGDLYPHGSRVILDPKWVVPEEHVHPLA